MKILIIGYMHQKYDKRVYRTVKALSKEHEIIYQYWTKNSKEKEHIEDNVVFKPVYYVKNLKISPVKKIFNRINLDKKIIQMIKIYDYDILYMHSFLTSKPVKAFKIAKNRKKKIIFDIHEYHPEHFLENLTGWKKKLKLLIMWKIFKKQIELSDKLIFVSEDIKKDCFSKLKLIKESIIIKNYAAKHVSNKNKEKSIVFVGKTFRNLNEELESIKELIKRGFKFKIVGMNVKKLEDIKYQSISFLPYDKMMEEISISLFSLISNDTNKNKFYKNKVMSLPNKYFDSIAAETPVIVKKDLISVSKEVEKYKIGIIVDFSNTEETVEKIIDIYENHYNELIKNIRAHKNEFIWDREKERKFIDFIIN